MSTTILAASAQDAAPTTTWSRTRGLTRANGVLLVRNRLTLVYALVFPLVPLALALAGDGPADQTWVRIVGYCLLMAMLFSVFYSVLSMIVTRRDELVLKRLRTGEVRDAEIVAATVLPGAAMVLAVTVLVAAVAAPLGLSLPVNPLVVLVGVVLGVACFAGLALWTASWTANAEAAQLTSLPVFVVALIGSFVTVLPAPFDELAARTPGAALESLVGVGWLGLDGSTSLSFAETFAAAAPHLGVLLVWTVVAVALAQRSMRWEPRS